MIKKTLTYADLDGNMVTEDFYFHLSKNQLFDLEFSHQGGLSAVLKEMIDEDRREEAVLLIKKIIKMSYGSRSNDGRNWDPATPEEAERFVNSPAFDEILTGFNKNPDSILELIIGLFPADMRQQIMSELNSEETKPAQPPWIAENRDPTQAELMSMDTDQLRDLMRRRMTGGSTPVSSQPKQVL